MTVRLVVDELVLEGVHAGDAAAVRRATEDQLVRLLDTRSLEARPQSSLSVERMTQSSSAADVGTTVAAAIWDGLGGSTERREGSWRP